MPPRSETLPRGVLRLKDILTHLNAQPKLSLSGVKQLRLTLASKKAHYGAQHFVEENLPQIRWANPNLDIVVRKEMKTPQEHWKPEMVIEFESGKVETVDMNDKFSSKILRELMDKAGDDLWRRHVADCKKTGAPVLPDAPTPKPTKKAESTKDLPNLEEFFKANPSAKSRHEKARKEWLAKLDAQKAKREKRVAASTSKPPTPQAN
ncbi:hypothetical protein D9613_001524 [Agrocybe pediades]|uniref:Ribosomal protein/NADH dehydrogenase domain-containing protein n=1 Tax=Agrocybe pediades TaxID=84607 RepID=A0A8H4R6L1_9AGAR|nr:hypothetical protein D9613_001524 [Agrocybe pediades]